MKVEALFKKCIVRDVRYPAVLVELGVGDNLPLLVVQGVGPPMRGRGWEGRVGVEMHAHRVPGPLHPVGLPARCPPVQSPTLLLPTVGRPWADRASS